MQPTVHIFFLKQIYPRIFWSDCLKEIVTNARSPQCDQKATHGFNRNVIPVNVTKTKLQCTHVFDVLPIKMQEECRSHRHWIVIKPVSSTDKSGPIINKNIENRCQLNILKPTLTAAPAKWVKLYVVNFISYGEHFSSKWVSETNADGLVVLCKV